MFDIGGIPIKQLTALRFKDEQEFRKAARVAVFSNTPADVPGRHTLIVRRKDEKLFKSAGLEFVRERILDPEKISSLELSRLRIAHWKKR